VSDIERDRERERPRESERETERERERQRERERGEREEGRLGTRETCVRGVGPRAVAEPLWSGRRAEGGSAARAELPRGRGGGIGIGLSVENNRGGVSREHPEEEKWDRRGGAWGEQPARCCFTQRERERERSSPEAVSASPVSSGSAQLFVRSLNGCGRVGLR
jgi:hypothetical protein